MNALAGNWATVEVQNVHADAWVDANRSPETVAESPMSAATPTRGSLTSSSFATPCKPSTPCSRRRAFRRQVYRSAARPCSRKAEDGTDGMASGRTTTWPLFEAHQA
jgi:hypothetical protein